MVIMSTIIYNKVKTLCFILVFFPFAKAVCLHFYCSVEYHRSVVVQGEDRYKGVDYHSVGDGCRSVDVCCHFADGRYPVHPAGYDGFHVVVYPLVNRCYCAIGCSSCAS